MKFWRVIVLWLCCFTAMAAEVIPPKPQQFFNDYANITSMATQSRLNNALADYERQTSSQILVAVFPTMQTDSSMEDYTVRVARAWKVGLQGKDNGAVLFVFVKEHKMRIEVGYGLEGALPDALGKRIVEDEIAPHFKQGDFNGGLTAGVNAMMAATKGEYKGTGENNHFTLTRSQVLYGIFIFFIVALAISRMASRAGFGGSGWWIAANVLSGWNSGGGGRNGGGGGWSSGGGSFGGGGASGSW